MRIEDMYSRKYREYAGLLSELWIKTYLVGWIYAAMALNQCISLPMVNILNMYGMMIVYVHDIHAIVGNDDILFVSLSDRSIYQKFDEWGKASWNLFTS